MARPHAERGLRKRSTTHLFDEGYWLWLIQLASGPISIGVCADPRFHPCEEIKSFDAFIDWLQENEPQLGARDRRPARRRPGLPRVEDFSYASSRVFSTDRWSLVGEAGGFIDALYSPGSDFIAYTNTFSADLINRDLDGEADIEERVDFYNFFFFRLFDPTIELYRDQYQFFGNPQVMVAKLLYDNMYYFTLLGSPFVHGKMTKIEDIERFGGSRRSSCRAPQDAAALQGLACPRPVRHCEGVSVLPEAARAVHQGAGGDRDARLATTSCSSGPARRPSDQGDRRLDLPQGGQEPARPSPTRPSDQPDGVSLQPERWEEDGLFSARA